MRVVVMEHDSIVVPDAVPDPVNPEKKHSVHFLLNSSNSSLPRLPLSSTSTSTTTSSYSAHPSSSLSIVADDIASSSTRAESESTPFDELLTAAHLLETSRARTADLPSLSAMIPGNITTTATDSKVLRNGAGSGEASVASSVVSSGRVMKRRKKRASVPCDICGRLFGEAAAVRKHKRVVHLKVKDFACDVCSRKFAEKSNLKKHIQARHQQTRAHKCSECGKVFNFTDGLRRHFNNCHLGLRPYNCDICSSRFKQRTHLQKHKQSVHNIKRTQKTEATTVGPVSGAGNTASGTTTASAAGSMNSLAQAASSTSAPSSSGTISDARRF